MAVVTKLYGPLILLGPVQGEQKTKTDTKQGNSPSDTLDYNNKAFVSSIL